MGQVGPVQEGDRKEILSWKEISVTMLTLIPPSQATIWPLPPVSSSPIPFCSLALKYPGTTNPHRRGPVAPMAHHFYGMTRLRNDVFNGMSILRTLPESEIRHLESCIGTGQDATSVGGESIWSQRSGKGRGLD